MRKENRRGINEKSKRDVLYCSGQGERKDRKQDRVWDVTVTPWSCVHPLPCDITGWCWLGQQGNTHAHSCFHKPYLPAVPKALQRSRLFRHVKAERKRTICSVGTWELFSQFKGQILHFTYSSIQHFMQFTSFLNNSSPKKLNICHHFLTLKLSNNRKRLWTGYVKKKRFFEIELSFFVN